MSKVCTYMWHKNAKKKKKPKKQEEKERDTNTFKN